MHIHGSSHVASLMHACMILYITRDMVERAERCPYLVGYLIAIYLPASTICRNIVVKHVALKSLGAASYSQDMLADVG